MRARRFFTAVLTLSATGLIAPAPAVAGTVAIGAVTRDGDVLSVRGSSSFTQQPFVTLGTDPEADVPAAFHHTAGDLVGASMATTPSGQVKLRWVVTFMPGFVLGTPALTYGWTYCLTNGGCYELDVQRYGSTNPPSLAAHGVLWRCADASCAVGDRTLVQSGGFSVIFEGDETITATLPTAAGLSAGSVLRSVARDPNGPAFTTIGTAEPWTSQPGSGDGVASISDYTVPSKEVAIGIAASGADPTAVTYPATTTPLADGTWQASVDVSGLRGDMAVYVRSCLGSNNCAYASTPVTL